MNRPHAKLGDVADVNQGQTPQSPRLVIHRNGMSCVVRDRAAMAYC